MKKNIKLKSLIVMLVLVLSLSIFLVSCGKSNNVLTVATNAEFQPFEYVNKNGDLAGIDIAFVNVLSKELGYEKAEITNMSFDAVFPSVQKKSHKIGVAGISINEERKKLNAFSIPYYDTYLVAIVKDTNTELDAAKTKADVDAVLKSKDAKSLLYVKGFTAGYYLSDPSGDVQKEESSLTVMQSVGYAAKAVQSSETNILVTDAATAKATVASIKGLKVIDIPLSEEIYCVLLNKEDTELKAKIDVVIEKMKKDGSLQKLIDSELAKLGNE